MHSLISVFKTNFLSSGTTARVVLNSHFFHLKNLLAERWKYHCSYKVKIINMSLRTPVRAMNIQLLESGRKGMHTTFGLEMAIWKTMKEWKVDISAAYSMVG
jgi:hypothetical protein